MCLIALDLMKYDITIYSIPIRTGLQLVKPWTENPFSCLASLLLNFSVKHPRCCGTDRNWLSGTCLLGLVDMAITEYCHVRQGLGLGF